MSNRDLSFLEPREGDTEELQGQKTYWKLVMDMPKPERMVFLQDEKVKEEEDWLDWMITSNKNDDIIIENYANTARELIQDHEMYELDTLDRAEQYMDIVRSTKELRYSIADIRKQREKIQWERRILTELNTYSKNSKT